VKYKKIEDLKHTNKAKKKNFKYSVHLLWHEWKTKNVVYELKRNEVFIVLKRLDWIGWF